MYFLVSSVVLGAISTAVHVSAQCSAPSNLSYFDSALPDPFQFIDGNRTKTKADWECRRNQISQLFQQYELGFLPTTTPHVTATASSTLLNITVVDNDRSISFSPSISYPSNGIGPFPAIIAYDGLSLPQPAGVAVITFNNDEMAAQVDTTSRGQGLFYNIYGSNATASAMIAWAWGVSRIIDALEQTSATNKIDVSRLAVTGCSRDGKGALVAGAFETRIALTIPQESGSGGDACWRLSQAEQAAGRVVQTAPEIVTENVWFSTAFDNYVNNLPTLPFDHHMLAGLVAPRGLLAFENTAYDWLSPQSSFGCMSAAREVYRALGALDSFGFSQDGNHSHCVFPSDQMPELEAFYDKFLLDKAANTDVFKSNETWLGSRSQWINWTTPALT